jgi:hypothetical protein
VGLDVHPREAMTRTGHDLKELRDGVQEVEDLWNEQQEQSLTEVSMDSNNRKGHSSEVTKGISNKH